MPKRDEVIFPLGDFEEDDVEMEKITVLLTSAERGKMVSAARRNNLSLEEFIKKCGLSGTRKRRSRDKQIVAQMVRNMEITNRLRATASKKEMKNPVSLVNLLMEGEKKLWEC